ncbi:nitroreductase [Ramlibacter sp. USB13]|uniref:Putative NAD(P)H nitroreductase n=1 Tax=Ramlibacter cellulosilyticus TaxID=2764187 RepID=A0A923MQQ6_9BURK|nr:nitroreductase [Ramlibacter cellulosilyticus]MBC5783093.1 nitroreductase [Ramlibacter cellulosilyticus]
MTQQPDTAVSGEWAEALIHGRRTVLPKRLAAPGPDPMQLQRILGAAAAAPDHGELLPWRFVLVPEPARGALAEAFAQALRERDAQASGEQLAQAREKAFRAPLLLLAVADLGEGGEAIPATERLVSAGCAIQNMLLMATALGFGSALTSGKAMDSGPLRALFSLRAQERALCFVSIGTIAGPKRGRTRPAVDAYVRVLEAGP